MSAAQRVSVLGLPYLYTYKLYFKPILRRRRWSEIRFERWLEARGLQVLDGGTDEGGEYMVVGTYDAELAGAIERTFAAHEQR